MCLILTLKFYFDIHKKFTMFKNVKAFMSVQNMQLWGWINETCWSCAILFSHCYHCRA